MTIDDRIAGARETLARIDSMIRRSAEVGAAAARQGNVEVARAMDRKIRNFREQKRLVQEAIERLMDRVEV
jgi:hypothetical protein